MSIYLTKIAKKFWAPGRQRDGRDLIKANAPDGTVKANWLGGRGDEVFVTINGETHYLWGAVDHEGETLVSYVTRKREKSAALRFFKKTLKRHGSTATIVTDGLRSYPAAMKYLGVERTCNGFVPATYFTMPIGDELPLD